MHPSFLAALILQLNTARFPWVVTDAERDALKSETTPMIRALYQPLLALDDASFRTVFAGSPIKRIGRNRMVRNAAIAAGNSGDPSLISALGRLVSDSDGVVAEAATWAIAELS